MRKVWEKDIILLLNGSLRKSKSNSNHFLNLLKTQLKDSYESVQLHQLKDLNIMKDLFQKADACVIGMPVYVDGVPAQVMEFMEQMYLQYQGQFAQLPVYVIANLGFYESKQSNVLLEIVKNWCSKMGFFYGGGLAIGAGEMLGTLKKIPLDQGPNQQLGKGIRQFAEAISDKRCIEDINVKPSYFPRRLYILAAHRNWYKMSKQNGLHRKALYQRPVVK